MKNKKSKIIIPAMGLILLSTAASISGSVAWFTANRTAKFNAGDFAVVNTKGNLQFELVEGLGTDISAGAVTNETNKTLTDASFDHISNDHYIFAPDETGYKVGKKVPLASATLDDVVATGIQRDTEGKIFSAFSWTVNFKLTVPSSATKDIGLFFSANEARMAKKVTLPAGTIVPENTYYTKADLATAVEAGVLAEETICYTQTTTAPTVGYSFAANAAIPGNTYYSDTACTEAYAGREAGGDTEAKTVYKKDSELAVDTGIGFRIAIVGTTATYTETRVWSDLQSSANAKHVLASAAVNALFDDDDEDPTNDITAAYVAPALIDSGLNTDPENLGNPESSARSVFTDSPLYLGYFDKNQAGNIVTLSFTCVAWFEGTDPKIVNNLNTVYDTMASYLAFETIDLPNA